MNVTDYLLVSLFILFIGFALFAGFQQVRYEETIAKLQVKLEYCEEREHDLLQTLVKQRFGGEYPHMKVE